jgi:hypothetical protein
MKLITFFFCSLPVLAILALAGCQTDSAPGMLDVAPEADAAVLELRLAVKDEPACLELRDSVRAGTGDSTTRAVFVATCVVQLPPGAPKPLHPLSLPEFRCDFARVLLDSGHTAVIPGVRDHCPELCASLAATDSAVHARQCVKPVPPPIPTTPLPPARCVEVLANLERCEDNTTRQNDQCAANTARQDSVCTANTARQDSVCAAHATRADGNCATAAANQAAQCNKLADRIAAECTVEKPHCNNLRTQLAKCTDRAAARAAECTQRSQERAAQCAENSVRRVAQCAENSARREAQCTVAAERRSGNCQRPRDVLEIRCTEPVEPGDSAIGDSVFTVPLAP